MRGIALAALLLANAAYAQTPTFTTLTTTGAATIGGTLTVPNAVTTLGSGARRNTFGSGWPTGALEVNEGSAAAPLGVPHETVHISHTEAITDPSLCNNNTGGNTECNTPLNVQSFGLPGGVQVISAIKADAHSASAANSQGGNFFGYADANGFAEGAYIQGTRSTGSGHAIGAELRVSSATATDCPAQSYTVIGWCDGLWITADTGGISTTNTMSGAVHIGNPYSVAFKEGITFNNSSVTQKSYNDQSASAISVNIGGTHGTAAISSDDGAGVWLTKQGQITLGYDTRNASANIDFDTAANFYRSVTWHSAGLQRWLFGVNNTAESGSNVGADMTFSAYNDAGGFLYTPLTITRSTGVVSMPQGATISQVNVTTTAGPNIRAGTGAATGTQPAGSIWIRTDGAAGSRIYVSQGGGTWVAIAGV